MPLESDGGVGALCRSTALMKIFDVSVFPGTRHLIILLLASKVGFCHWLHVGNCFNWFLLGDYHAQPTSNL